MTESPPAVRCSATNRQGKPCGAYAVPGATVCRMHGGSAPQVRRAAARRLQAVHLEGSIGAMLAELEADALDVSPVAVLLEQVARTHAMVQVLGALVGELESPDGPVALHGESVAVLGRAIDGRHLFGRNHLGDGAPHVLVEMYATWIDRATRASKLACDAGVEERLVSLAEDQAKLMAEVMRAFAVALGLDPHDDAVREKMRTALTTVAGAA